MTFFILLLGGLLALPLTAIGLPGLWAYLAMVGIWKLANDALPISWATILVAFALAVVAEVIEWVLASRYTTKYGGSKRAGWGAIIGGIVGAFVGFPVPIVGPMIGSFAGAFVGALVGEYTSTGRHVDAGRVAWGALVGRVVAVAVKVSITFAIMIILLFASFG